MQNAERGRVRRGTVRARARTSRNDPLVPKTRTQTSAHASRRNQTRASRPRKERQPTIRPLLPTINRMQKTESRNDPLVPKTRTQTSAHASRRNQTSARTSRNDPLLPKTRTQTSAHASRRNQTRASRPRKERQPTIRPLLPTINRMQKTESRNDPLVPKTRTQTSAHASRRNQTSARTSRNDPLLPKTRTQTRARASRRSQTRASRPRKEKLPSRNRQLLPRVERNLERAVGVTTARSLQVGVGK